MPEPPFLARAQDVSARLLYRHTVASTPDIADYRRAVGHFATGVTVVTSMTEDGRAAGLTANAVCSLSLDPLLMVVCLDHGSRTLQAVRATRRLAVNVLAHGQKALAVTFSGKQHEDEKFDGLGWHEEGGVPILDGVVSWLAGDLDGLLPGGDHEIGVARITAVGAGEGDPLIYYRGLYHGLGEGLLD